MEENQSVQTPTPTKKEKKGYPLVIVIILAILAIGGISFGAFELINKNEQTNCITTSNREDNKDENETGQENQKQENEITRESNQEIQEQETETTKEKRESKILAKTGIGTEIIHVYLPWIYLLPNQTYKDNYFLVSDNKKEWEISYINGEESYQITTINQDELYPYYGFLGQDGFVILFITKNGDVEYLTMENFTDFKTQELKELKNIVRFTQIHTGVTGGYDIIAEDKNGNTYKLSDYLY